MKFITKCFTSIGNLYILLLLLPQEGYSTLTCVDFVNTTCSNISTSKWNKRNVGENLKFWLNSFERIPFSEASANKPTEHRKKVLRHPRSNIIQLIGKTDCLGETIIGPVWKIGGLASKRQFHNGFFYGNLDENGRLTGENIVFMYPDMETIFVGRFVNETMISAKPSKVIAERCNQGMKEIKIAKPKPNTSTFRYSRPTRIRIGDQPAIMDPYERKNIYVSDGEEGDGVFARKNISKGEVIMYYSGLRWNKTQIPLWTRNQTLEDRLSIQTYLIKSAEKSVVMYMPEPYNKVEHYRATLGHKMNHSFKYAKAQMTHAFHPRFGDIRAYYATSNIFKGEEIFVNYGYEKGGMVPEWYSLLYEKEVGKPWYS